MITAGRGGTALSALIMGEDNKRFRVGDIAHLIEI